MESTNLATTDIGCHEDGTSDCLSSGINDMQWNGGVYDRGASGITDDEAQYIKSMRPSLSRI